MLTTDPHHRDAAAAIAGMSEIYGTAWKPKPGDIVIVPEPFSLRPVKATVQHAHGHVVLVVTEKGEQLEYDREECGRTF
jgi:hypothetical protein